MTATNEQDAKWMRQAIALSDRARGTTGDNPNVGCVIVADARVVGRGSTAPGGRPHAEVAALTQAGSRALGATAFVTLEPCCHTGRSGACTDALIKAGVARVVYAVEDPNPRVSGKGHRALEAAGIQVSAGCLEGVARRSMAGFLTRLRLDRPHVTLKLASSIDGRSALADGSSQWITGQPARQAGHLLRARSDAILVGAATVLADAPALTTRLDGLEHRSPTRFVLDPDDLLDDRDGWNRLPTRDLGSALSLIAELGVNWLMVETGGRLAASLIEANLVDQVWWAQAPMILGGDSLSAIGNLTLQALSAAPRYEIVEQRMLGADRLTILERTPLCLPD